MKKLLAIVVVSLFTLNCMAVATEHEVSVCNKSGAPFYLAVYSKGTGFRHEALLPERCLKMTICLQAEPRPAVYKNMPFYKDKYCGFIRLISDKYVSKSIKIAGDVTQVEIGEGLILLSAK